MLGVLYALFLAATVAVHWIAPQRLRGAVLLAASLLFYASASPRHALLIVGLGLAVWLACEALRRSELQSRRTALVAALCGLCVAVLAYFKYARFLVETVDSVRFYWQLPALPASGLLPLTVPLGISFFTFEFIHYLVDVYRGKTAREQPHTAADFLKFALFFPTLLAGPIKRFQQFSAASRLLPADAAYGLGRLALGVVKKVLLADTVAGLASRLAVPDQVTTHGLWLATYAYALQIYLDFSGYSDMAIGAARLLGYQVPENFNWPYLSTSLPEFWRRWHISLSTWIRDYLFIPLGGSRVAAWRNSVNLLLVMALCGLWHGPAWHFVAWGLWHGAGLAATRLWRRRFAAPVAPSLGRRVVAGLLTFHFVCLGWVLFATPSLAAAWTAFRRMVPIFPPS